MTGLDQVYPHSEESTPGGLTNQEVEERLKHQLDECDQKLRIQELEAERLLGEQQQNLVVQELVVQLIETSREHCAQLEEIRLAALEIYLSNMLNQAHSTLLSGLLGGSNIREYCRAADEILKDVAKTVVRENIQNIVSSQTWAKNYYVNGIHAEMTNKPEAASMLYIYALKQEPRYRDLKRVSRFLDRHPRFPKTPLGGNASGDSGRNNRRSTVILKTPGSENRNSWLFQILRESTTTTSGTGIGTVDKVLIDQVYKDKSRANSRVSNQSISPNREVGNRGNLTCAAATLAKPAPPSSPRESGARHTAPGVRKTSFGDDDPELIDEFSPLSDTPQPSELARPAKPLREEVLRRARLHPLDTSAARKPGSSKASASHPHPPSPLRMVSVNEIGSKDEASTEASKEKEASKMP